MCDVWEVEELNKSDVWDLRGETTAQTDWMGIEGWKVTAQTGLMRWTDGVWEVEGQHKKRGWFDYGGLVGGKYSVQEIQNLFPVYFSPIL